MKIKIIALLAAVMLLCSGMLFSCAEDEIIKIDLNDLAKVIGEKIDLSNTVGRSAEQAQDDYGIMTDDIVQIVVLRELDVNSAEMLILVEAKDKETTKQIEENLKIYKTNKLNELTNYTLNPDNERQYYIVEGAEIVVNQQYVFWAVYTQSKEINDIIKDYIKNNK